MGSKVQVLVAAMHQNDHSLLKKLNIQSDVIVGNQCDRDQIERFCWNEYDAVYLNFHERGVGLNRNNALMRATGDICLFADDDMTYVENYPQRIEESFAQYPEADVIVFNLVEDTVTRNTITKAHRVRWYNCLRYGAVRIAIKRSSIKKQGIAFNLSFGGGTEYSHGEDTLFLVECLKRGLKIVAVPVCLARLTQDRDSTWFQGYTDKYLRDKGALYSVMSRKWCTLLCLQDAIRFSKKYNRSWLQSYRIMKQGR